MFSPGDRVTVKNSRTVGEWAKAQTAGKVGTVIGPDHPKGGFDWVVHFEGTDRIGGNFAFFEEDLDTA